MRQRARATNGTEDGLTILEVVIALTIFAIVITGLATSTALGLRIVSASNGRQIASQLATKELERLRRTAYDDIALSATPSLVAGTLDSALVGSPATDFAVPGAGTEPLVVSATGKVGHTDTEADGVTLKPKTVEGFSFTITRYVTWVDDPDLPLIQDYKRATIAVQWRQKTATGGASRVVLSSIFSVGKVVFP